MISVLNMTTIPKENKISKNINLLYILIFLNLINFSFQTCGFEQHRKKEVAKFDEEDHGLRFLQNQQFEPIRLYFDYSTLDNQTTISQEVRDSVKLVLNTAKSVFETILKVRRLKSKAKFSHCDSSVSVSSLISQTGVEADIVIFPYIDTNISGNTEAYASACIVSGRNNRPVAGLIAFSKFFNITRANWKDYYTNLAIHEMTHILLFNPDMFNNFVDANENLIPLNKTLKVVETSDGLVMKYIISPKVVEAAKRYYNCSNITGVELENQGGQGTFTSHWEARTMLSDYMIGVSYDEMTMSEITLAFFEDSGWYQVNYYTGGLFRYGKHEGCPFLKNKCVSTNGKIDFGNEFCSGEYTPVCTASKTSKGICYITSYETDIDTNFRYFSASKKGGLALADFCPVAAVPNNETSYFPWSCTIGFHLYPSELEENISSDSACFMSNLVKNDYVSKLDSIFLYSKSICYKFNCDYIKRTLNVTIGNKTVNCPISGGYVTLENYTGKLLCPDFNQLCTSTERCNSIVECALKRVLPLDPFYNYTINYTVSAPSTLPSGEIFIPPIISESSSLSFQTSLLFIVFTIFIGIMI